jgi:hypothetical protein
VEGGEAGVRPAHRGVLPGSHAATADIQEPSPGIWNGLSPAWLHTLFLSRRNYPCVMFLKWSSVLVLSSPVPYAGLAPLIPPGYQ